MKNAGGFSNETIKEFPELRNCTYSVWSMFVGFLLGTYKN